MQTSVLISYLVVGLDFKFRLEFYSPSLSALCLILLPAFDVEFW